MSPKYSLGLCLALALLFSVEALPVSAVTEGGTGKVFDTKVYYDETEYSLLGVGRREKKIMSLSINLYAVGFYLHTKKGQAALLPYKEKDPDQLKASQAYYDVLRNPQVPRHIRIIMSTNMVNKGKMQEGLKEALVPAIKNHVDPEKDGDPDTVANDKAHKLLELFDSDPKDNDVFDFTCDAKGTLTAVMNKKAKDPMDEPLICAGFTDVYIGTSTVSPTLKEDVAGRLNIIFDEGDNADIEEPVTKIKFKEFVKGTPEGSDQPEDLHITGTASMTLLPRPNPWHLKPAKSDLAFAMYSNWFQAQSQLVEKYSDSQKALGDRDDFRDDLLSGPWGRAVLVKTIADDFTRKEISDNYMKAFNDGQNALGVNEAARSSANDEVKKIMDEISNKVPSGVSINFYCDATGHLSTTITGMGDDVLDALKNKVTFEDAKSCTAALHAWAGSRTIMKRLRTARSINWDNLSSELVWDEEVMEVGNVKFRQVRKMTNDNFVQFIGGAKQVHPGAWTDAKLDATSVIGLFVSTDAATGGLKDLEGASADKLSEPDVLKKILMGEFAHSLDFVQASTDTFSRFAKTAELVNQDMTKNVLKKVCADDTARKTAEDDLKKIVAWKTNTAFDRVRVECDAAFKMTALHVTQNGDVKATATSDEPCTCKGILQANVAENNFLKGRLPDPEVFNGLWTADK